LPVPRAILAISAHLVRSGHTRQRSAAPRPPTIHDFNSNFPPALFEFAYPAPGDAGTHRPCHRIAASRFRRARRDKLGIPYDWARRFDEAVDVVRAAVPANPQFERERSIVQAHCPRELVLLLGFLNEGENEAELLLELIDSTAAAHLDRLREATPPAAQSANEGSERAGLLRSLQAEFTCSP
jgi:hypothetical protein